MNNDHQLITIKGVNKKYGERPVLQGIDWTIKKGTITGLLGKNGSGKTTLIKCMLGILSPDEGGIEVFGEKAWEMSGKTKHRIGYVPQNAAGFEWMRIRELLEYISSFYDCWDFEKINGLIEDWELDPQALVGNLSVGERQKVAILQAFGHDPELLVFDEPVAGLDPVARRQFLRKLNDLNIEEGKTVLFSTHITSDIERVAAEVVLLRDGVISFNGELDDLKERVIRLRILGKEKLPDTLPVPNIISGRIDGNRAVVTVDGFEEKNISELEHRLSAEVTVENLNLEDIFMEMNQ